jgi:acetyltransferase-like isoleucine patch superfamily enzyme
VKPLDPATLDLQSFGEDVLIYPLVRLTRPDRISIGSHVIVDDFVMLQGGEGLEIGNYVHIASFASISGGGQGFIGDGAGIASGVRILTGTDLADGSGLMGPQMPEQARAVIRPGVRIEGLAFIGANTVVHPGVTIGEGAVVGAQSLVLSDLAPWTINVGIPARVIRERPREVMLRQAAELGYVVSRTA